MKKNGSEQEVKYQASSSKKSKKALVPEKKISLGEKSAAVDVKELSQKTNPNKFDSTSIVSKPAFYPGFTAKQVATTMEWNDLVVPQKTARQINDIKTWLLHNDTFLQDWGMAKRIKAGYRALFYGPPGTGKTLTATLLGKQFEKDVFRIDLLRIVSGYIGETEKNIDKVLNNAANQSWILFFDEAEALFGKRSSVKDAHDRYANIEINYLLQRIEDYSGLIIFNTTTKGNLDKAFVRRLNAIIHFAMPAKKERLEIWRAAIPPKATLADDADLNTLAAKYELSGSAIVDVLHYASLQSISKSSTIISMQDITEGIKNAFEKDDRVFTLG